MCWDYGYALPHSSLHIPVIEHHMRCSVFEWFLQVCGLDFHSLNNVSWKARVSVHGGRQFHWLPLQVMLLSSLYDHLLAPTSLWAPPEQRPLPALVFLALKQYLALRRQFWWRHHCSWLLWERNMHTGPESPGMSYIITASFYGLGDFNQWKHFSQARYNKATAHPFHKMSVHLHSGVEEWVARGSSP